MIAKPDLSVILPCHNESVNIQELFRRLEETLVGANIKAELVVVDDASSDGTSSTVLLESKRVKVPVELIKHDINRGIFEAWKTGLENSSGRYVVFMDSDLQNQPESIKDLWLETLEGRAHFVQATRTYVGSHTGERHRSSKALNSILNFIFRDEAKDSKSGFFMAPRQVAVDVLNIQKKYAYPHTFVRVAAKAKGYSLAEVSTPFEPRKAGESLFASAKMLRVYLNVLLDFIPAVLEFGKTNHPAEYMLKNFASSKKDPQPYKGLRKALLILYYRTIKLHGWLLRPKTLEIFLSLRKVQHSTLNELDSYRNERLARLLWHAYVNVPYYRELFLRSNLTPADISTVDKLETFPLLSKTDVLNNIHFRMFDRGYIPSQLHKISTSGSTGSPSTTYAERTQLEVRHATTMRSAEWTGWRVGDRQMRLWHQTLGMSRSQAFREKFDALLIRRKFIPAFEMTEDRVRELTSKINRFKPVLIDGYAESLNFLANYFNGALAPSHKPKAVMSSAQMLTSQTRGQIESGLGAQVFDKYGAREFSGIAYECVEGVHHVMDDSYIVEVLRNGKRAKAGELGEVVITDLNNFAVPLIRYRIGDLAIAGKTGKCNCGSSFSQIGEIQGRTQALVFCANGRWLPGTFFAHFFKDYEHQVKFFQIVQSKKHEFSLKIVKADSWTAGGTQSMLEDLMEFVGETLVSIQYVDSIPLLKTGKRTPVVSSIKPDFQTLG